MAGNYDKYGNYDFSMFEPKPVSFDHNAARKIATLPGVGERAADSGMLIVTRKKKTTVLQASLLLDKGKYFPKVIERCKSNGFVILERNELKRSKNHGYVDKQNQHLLFQSNSY